MRKVLNRKHTTRFNIKSKGFYALHLRKIIENHELLVILRYDGDSSKQLNDFRFHILNHNSNMVLITSKLIASVFQLNSVNFFNTRILLLYANNYLHIIEALKQGEKFLEIFPFIAFSYKTFFSQKNNLEIIKNFNDSYFFNSYRLLAMSIFTIIKIILRKMTLNFSIITYKS